MESAIRKREEEVQKEKEGILAAREAIEEKVRMSVREQLKTDRAKLEREIRLGLQEENEALLTEMTRKVMQGEIIEPFEWRLHSVDDRIVWVMGLLMRIEFQGRPALLGSYIDITEAKQTGWELQRTYKKLEEVRLDLRSARDEERAQIAWELQENLGETLSSLKQGLLDIKNDNLPSGQSGELIMHREKWSRSDITTSEDWAGESTKFETKPLLRRKTFACYFQKHPAEQKKKIKGDCFRCIEHPENQACYGYEKLIPLNLQFFDVRA